MPDEQQPSDVTGPFCVIVARLQPGIGWIPNQVYARGLDREEARKLHRAAFVRGYRDVRVESEKDFFEAQDARRRSPPGAGGAARRQEQQRLHGVRTQRPPSVA